MDVEGELPLDFDRIYDEFEKLLIFFEGSDYSEDLKVKNLKRRGIGWNGSKIKSLY